MTREPPPGPLRRAARFALTLALTAAALALCVLGVLVLAPRPRPRDWTDASFLAGGDYTLGLLGALFAGLSIMFAVAGAAVWLWFRDWARRQLVDGARDQIEREFGARVRVQQRQIAHLADAHALVETALAHWAVHVRALTETSAAADAAQRRAREDAAAYALDAAIVLGGKAFELVYPDRDSAATSGTISNLVPDDYELLFAARVVSNLSYFLVARGADRDLRIAAERLALMGALAGECRARAVTGWRDIMESHIWVRFRTGAWDAQRVAEELRSLRTDPQRPEAWEESYRGAGVPI